MRLLAILICLPALGFAQGYNVNAIPDSLKQNANAVKRFEEWKVIIKSTSKATIKHKWAVTILNEKGAKFSGYINRYDKDHSIKDIDGKLFDANGKELKSIKKKDISDLSDDNDMNLMTDSRYKHHSFYHNTYPYTVEYEDEVDCDETYSFPKWIPVEDEKFSVQHSRYVVEAPKDYQLRFKQFQFADKPIETSDTRSTVRQWELKNRPAIENEIYQPEWDDLTPRVVIAPTKFEISGYSGDMSSWKGLGQFAISLYTGRDALPDNVKADVHKLTDNITDRNEKIRVLYDYMQKNTRYISIQLGIGGLQPFPAKDVAAKKYGDCKALSNYMVSMLKEAGVKAYSVWINSGEGEKGLIEDFPGDYFNHVVVSVPNGKDTTWLECTSQTLSAGYMGGSTGNRKALLIGDDGGYVVSTPTYTSKDNLQVRKINAVVSEDGNLSVDVSTRFTGQQQELQHSLVYSATPEQRQRYLNNAISLSTYKVEKSEYKEQKGKIPVIDEYLKITASNYATVSGKRLFIVPNMFNRGGSKLSTETPRKFDIKFDYPYRDVDTIHITIPNGYETEALPKDVSVQTKFGTYSINFKVNGNSIDVLRINERYAGIFPASEYQSLAKYFEEMYKADRSRIVLVKKES